MRTSTTQARNFRPTISKIVMALAIASVMGGVAMTPAHGADKGWHKGQGKGDRDQPVYVYRPVYPYYYSYPVYAPPPVYYYPQQSPGISLFFPLHIEGR